MTPSDLVREQDFILRIRRLHRMGTPYVVVNFSLNTTTPEQGGRGIIESVHERISEWANSQNIYVAEMSDGDIFLSKEAISAPPDMAEKAFSIIWPEGLEPEKKAQAMLSYRMPHDYTSLRERLNYYVEASRKAAIYEGESSPSRLLRTDAAKGPLTPWTMDQIERLFTEIDIYRYIRTQPICERQSDGKWKRLFDEYYIGFEALRAERFPKLEKNDMTHLFLALCQSMDQHLLTRLADDPTHIEGRKLSINLSITSIVGNEFAKFARSLSPASRELIYFELHRGDLFQDFSTTVNAIETLRTEGFKIIIDHITPRVLPYVNLQLMDVDYFKIDVSSARAEQLQNPATMQALAKLPREKLIFSHCDTETAFMTGINAGVTKFQGWLIENYLRAEQ
ncbi:MAG: EAL domain-containing protein [Alphaproteobacteria bacterium]|nr:EAL domain-containing protein [Alphaproteobacteria bacterium]